MRRCQRRPCAPYCGRGWQQRWVSLYHHCRGCRGCKKSGDGCRLPYIAVHPNLSLFSRGCEPGDKDGVPNVFVVDVAGASEDCGVHHLVDFVVVGAAQEDKVAPLLSPPSSSSKVREDGIDGVPPNAVYRRRRGRQGAGDDGKLCPTLHQSPPWSCLRLRRGRR